MPEPSLNGTGVHGFSSAEALIVEKSKYRFASSFIVIATVLAGCSSKSAQQAAPAAQAMPVQTVTVAPQPVPRADEYVSTIKSRRSATITPQVSGNLVKIIA